MFTGRNNIYIGGTNVLLEMYQMMLIMSQTSDKIKNVKYRI